MSETAAEARAKEIWGMNPNPKPWDALSSDEKSKLIAMAIEMNATSPSPQIWNDLDDDTYPNWMRLDRSDIEFSFDEFSEGPIVIFVGKPGQSTGHNIRMSPIQAIQIAERLIVMATLAEKAGKIGSN